MYVLNYNDIDRWIAPRVVIATHLRIIARDQWLPLGRAVVPQDGSQRDLRNSAFGTDPDQAQNRAKVARLPSEEPFGFGSQSPFWSGVSQGEKECI